MLFGIVGDSSVNNIIISHALDNTPSLLIDAANYADIHKFRDKNIEQYSGVYVLSVDSLYRFIPVLRKLGSIAKTVNTKNIFITEFTHLFNYDNDAENRDVYVYAWELISSNSREFNIYVAVRKGSIHEHLSMVHGMRKMGHTTTSQRMMVDKLLAELRLFGKSLDESDRELYNSLLNSPLKHLGSISYASPLKPEIFILLSIILEQEKRICEYEKMLDRRLQDKWKDNTLAQN